MNAAQVALATLVGVLFAAGTTLVIFEHDIWGGILLGFGLFGFLTVLSMVLNDARQRPFPPPRNP